VVFLPLIEFLGLCVVGTRDRGYRTTLIECVSLSRPLFLASTETTLQLTIASLVEATIVPTIKVDLTIAVIMVRLTDSNGQVRFYITINRESSLM
jgi:hypothetical protein